MRGTAGGRTAHGSRGRLWYNSFVSRHGSAHATADATRRRDRTGQPSGSAHRTTPHTARLTGHRARVSSRSSRLARATTEPRGTSVLAARSGRYLIPRVVRRGRRTKLAKPKRKDTGQSRIYIYIRSLRARGVAPGIPPMGPTVMMPSYAARAGIVHRGRSCVPWSAQPLLPSGRVIRLRARAAGARARSAKRRQRA